MSWDPVHLPEKPPLHFAWDQLHSELFQLLDQIEVQEDSDLARMRFEILEAHGYKAVAVATNPVIVPFTPRRVR